MSSEIFIGKDKFTYVNNGKYIRIIGYYHEDGTLIFTKEDDGRSYFHIHIPETIDDLPVLIVEPLWLDVDYGHKYRHNGYDVVKIHLPESTAFKGLSQVRIDQYSVFVPNYSEDYYTRENQLFRKDYGMYHFFAQKFDDSSCSIIAITSADTPKKDWVWSESNQVSAPIEKLVIPGCIEGCKVLEICTGSTVALPEKIEKIYIEEGVEAIGENCFSGLPYISSVYLPKSLKSIGSGSFGFYEETQYVKKVPVLWVRYYDAMPELGKGAFVREAEKEEYEEYADWGNMYAGSTHLKYEVIFQKYE